MRKLKPICSVSKGVKQCQLAAMPHLGEGDLCLFHARNSVLFPRVIKRSGERPGGNLQGYVELLRKEQNNLCCICGYRFYGNQDVEGDHLWPWAFGGKHDITNFGLAHHECNRVKRDLLLHDPEIRMLVAAIGKHAVNAESVERVLTATEEKEVCRRYLGGETGDELAEAYGLGRTSISRIFKRNGIEARSLSEARQLWFRNNPAHNKTDEKTEQEICRRYLAGENSVELGGEFGISAGTVTSILKRNGFKARSLRKFTDEQEQEICRRYLEGENTVELGREFNSTHIGAILKRNRVKARSIKEARGGFTPKQEKEVCRRYKAGESSPELARAFGKSASVIQTLVKEKGLLRTISEARKLKMSDPKAREKLRLAKGGFTDEQEREICREYEDGKSIPELRKQFGFTHIHRILKRNGVKMRSLAEGVRRFYENNTSPIRIFDKKTEKKISQSYLEGKSSIELGEAFGVSHRTISNILKRNGVKTRSISEARKLLYRQRKSKSK